MLQKSFKLFMALLLALTWLSPVSPAFAGDYTATFTFTASPEPSDFEHDATFTVTAVGPDEAPYPPFGDVTFYDNGAEIAGCTGESLNHVNYSPTAGVPATCTVTMVTSGTHTITAYFRSLMPDLYDSESLGPITHVVNEPFNVTILPETIPNGNYGAAYMQHLTFDATVTYSTVSGDMPPGWVYVLLDDGWAIGGRVTALGEYSFDISAIAYPGGRGSRTYTVNIGKATPNMDLYLPTNGFRAGSVETAYATANPDALDPNIGLVDPYGTVTFLLDGEPISTCIDLPTETSGNAICAFAAAGIPAGDHSMEAVFTPDAATGVYYTGATAAGILEVLPALYYIDINIFDDLDRDGVFDTDTEGLAQTDLNVNVDQGCDNTVESPGFTNTGTIVFGGLTAGLTYCVSIDLPAGYEQTTTNQFTLDSDHYPVSVGLYYPHLVITPATLPAGAQGEPYSQTFSVSNGTPPYTISNVYMDLVPGLTFDESTLTISGTPTAGGFKIIGFTITDAAGVTKSYNGYLAVLTPGVFNLTSSKNPAAPGEEITFTLTGTGEAYSYGSPDPFPPIGTVTFYDGDTAITGCTDVPLNYDDEWNVVDLPAVCTTSALAEGAHVITAAYTDMTWVYTGTGATLTQVIGLDAAPAITAQPAGQAVFVGDTTSFTSAANGYPAPTVQWQVSADSGATWADIAGATDATYAFTAAYAQNGAQYRAVWTNSAGSAATDAATLTVNKLTAAIEIANLDHTYDGAPKAATVSTTPAGLTVNMTYDGAGTPPAAAGTYTVLAAIDDSAYQGQATATLTIAPTPVTVAADAKTKYAGEADPALTYQVTSGALAASDSFSGALARDEGEAAGVYPIRQGTLALGSNYLLTFEGADLTILPVETTLALSAAPNPSMVGQAVHLTADLSIASSAITTAGGAVAFTADGQPIDGCSAVAMSAKQAICVTTALAAGSHSLQAVYSGDDNLNGSASEALSLEVYAPTARLVDSAATCAQFKAGTAVDLVEALYTIKSGKISSVTPGAAQYFTRVTAPASIFSLAVEQSNTSSWRTIGVQSGKFVAVYDANCRARSFIAFSYNNRITINVLGATPGATYYIVTRYRLPTLVNLPVRAPYPSVEYSFATSMGGSTLFASRDGLLVRPK